MLLSVTAYRYHIPNLETPAYETRKILSPASFPAYCVKSFKLQSDRLRINWVFPGFGSEQRKTEERDFRFWPREKWNESEKMKDSRHFSRGLWLSLLVLCSETGNGNACYVGSITSRCSGKWARTHPRLFGEDQDRTRETAEIEPTCYAD